MSKIIKRFQYGDMIPDSAVYLCSFEEHDMRNNRYIVHYFLVEVGE